MTIFRSTAELVAWMQDEYLSELLLRAWKPKPGGKKSPSRVSFEWGLVVPDNSKLQMYGVRATGVSRWTLAGDWDKHEVISFGPEAAGAAPIVLHQEVPGLLALECDCLEIERLPDKRWRPPPRARDDQFFVWGPRETSWHELVSWIASPDDVHVFEQLPGQRGNRRLDGDELVAIVKGPTHGAFRLQRNAEDRVPWLWVSWRLGIGTLGHAVSIERGTLAEAAWIRARALPGFLGDCTVISGTVRCTGAEWAAHPRGRPR